MKIEKRVKNRYALRTKNQDYFRFNKGNHFSQNFIENLKSIIDKLNVRT